MRYLINTSTDPYFNLALDEYAMQHIDVGEDYFFLWQNEPAIIVGKNQNTAEEINPQFVEDNHIKVARRVSGGGAVFHDYGNLNFTIITNVGDLSKVDFKKYVQPVIKALESMGVKAEASGRNDILIDGKKISGNAQRQEKGRLMHHGTLMFDVNVEDMVRSLNVAEDKFISKAAKSVRARVTNIKDHLQPGTTLESFWQQLHHYLSNEGKDAEIMLTAAQRQEIQQIADERFASWDWTYGKSPEFNYRNSERFPGGKVDVMVDVEAGKIKNVRFLGDYLGVNDVYEVEAKLSGVRYDKVDVRAVLQSVNFASYFGTITVDELLHVLF
jgi:lipoate-protein ligase A